MSDEAAFYFAVVMRAVITIIIIMKNARKLQEVANYYISIENKC